MNFREYCDIEASGGNPYPFINAIRQSPVACGNQHCRGSIFCCRVARSDLEALQEIAARCHMQLNIRRKRSVLGMFRRYRFRVGLAAGILLGAVLLFYQSNVVETIELQGNSTVADSVILSILEEEGVHRGVWIPDMDMLHLERRLRAAVPDLAWVGIRHTGNRLVVEVTEVKHAPELLHERTPCNIIAAENAQITDVKVYAGHLERLIGDGVAKGDLLVSGMYTNERGLMSYHHAIASVTGIFERETELTEPFTVTETVPTGNVVQQKWLRIFGLKLPLTFQQPDFTESTAEETETAFSFLGMTLPCGILQRTTAETVTTETTRTEEEVRLALHAAVVRYEKNLLADVTILNRTLDYTPGEDGITCHLYYRVEGEIGTESDFYIQK